VCKGLATRQEPRTNLLRNEMRSASLRRHYPYRFEGTLSANPKSGWHPQREGSSYWNYRSLARTSSQSTRRWQTARQSLPVRSWL